MFGISKEQTINGALAIEIFHNFTLLHDDIMDQAPLRRNKPSVHQKWNTNTAILAGDVLLVKAYQLLEQQPGDLRSLLQLFNRTAVEVCEGQQLDLDFESRKNISIQEYETMIRLKTSVLLSCALEMSALIAQTSSENRGNIAEFGLLLGLAFQIKDDILDLYADPDKFGKQVGGDILANKKTMLHLLAVQNASQQQTMKIDDLMHEPNATKKILETRKIFDQLNVRQLAMDKVNSFFGQAQTAMEKIDVPHERKQQLIELSYFLLDRQS